MDEVTFTGLVDPKFIKRIKVTCKCGHSSVYEVVEGPGTIPVIECKCGQRYAFGGVDKPLVRLDEHYQPEAKIMEKSKEGPTVQGIWAQPESKMVN